MCGESYSFQCGSNYPSSSGSSGSGCHSSAYTNAIASCQKIEYNYQCNETSINQCYHQSHSSCGAQTVNADSIALQDAAKIGAGVQGEIGCTVDACGQPTPPHLTGVPSSTTGDNTDGDIIQLAGANNSTTSVLGDGAGDQILVDSGNSNVMVAGNGAADILSVGSLSLTDGSATGGGNNNTLVAGNGDGDQLTVASGSGNILVAGDGVGDALTVGGTSDALLADNHNVLVAGNGDFDVLAVSAGDNNQLFAGNGANDVLVINEGDSNALIAGDGAGDAIFVSTGNNNDLHAGNGAGDFLEVFTGDNNCVTVGDGDGSSANVGTGASNDIEMGNGNNDIATVGTGDNNMLHVGNGAADILNVGSGDHNTLWAGAGAGDSLSVGAGNYNLLYSGDGAGDVLSLGSGNYNALIAGNGAGDAVVVDSGNYDIMAVGNGAGDLVNLESGNNTLMLTGNGANDTILVGGQVGTVGTGVNANNNIVMGDGNGDQAWGSLGDGNNYLTGQGNDLVHTGGGADFVYVHDHTEQSAAAMADPYHLTTQDSLAQNLFADGGNDTFVLQGTQQNCQTSYSCYSYNTSCHGANYSNALTWQNELKSVGGDAPGLGTTVMTGGGGVEKYWFSDLWGDAVITDFNSAHGDRIMIGGAYDGHLSGLGSVNFQYIHSAYDTANTGNVDLLITFGSGTQNISQSITLIDYKPQDTGNLFNNVTYTNPVVAEAALSHIFDFSQADNQAVTSHVASLAAQNLILQ